MMQQSAESEIERPTILTFEPWKARTSSRSWPTRFSRKTENWQTDGQFRACIVSKSISPPPVSPKLMADHP